MERFTWTYRQFVGGNAALDFANTVIYPDDAMRRFDRIVDAIELGRWVAAGVRLAALPAALERRFGEAATGRCPAAPRCDRRGLPPLSPAAAAERRSASAAPASVTGAAAVAGAPLMQADSGISLRTSARRQPLFLAHLAIECPGARLFAGGRPGESLSRLRLALHRP